MTSDIAYLEDTLPPPSDDKARKQQLATLARLAESADRYEDMCKFMKALVRTLNDAPTKSVLSMDERNLLSVAYKNVVGARRTAWRTLGSDEGRDSPLISEYRKQVEEDLERICLEVLALLEEVLIKCANDEEAQVFYLKMAGDYYRYLAEFRERSAGYHAKARELYSQALELAQGNVRGRPPLPPTHPIRLGLALNFSVCYYEILNEKQLACDLAHKAFEEAISKLDELDENSYRDSTLILHLLRDNLTLWSNDAEGLNVQDVDPEA